MAGGVRSIRKNWMKETPGRDYLGRTADAIVPLSLPVC